jgi:hypothetical protein
MPGDGTIAKCLASVSCWYLHTRNECTRFVLSRSSSLSKVRFPIMLDSMARRYQWGAGMLDCHPESVITRKMKTYGITCSASK